MKTSNSDHTVRNNYLVWCLLAEYAVGEMMPDNGKDYARMAGFLFQPFLEWGLPPELINKIELSLIEFAQKAKIPASEDRLERPGRFRVFCQKKMIAGAGAASTMRSDPAGPALEAVPIQEASGANLNRGWGYFIIDRSGGEAGSAERCSLVVDLYLYQEGE